ncbi:MAG: Gfo/Idh/MocA family oxidoreductase, partial [Litorilinea sp.]
MRRDRVLGIGVIGLGGMGGRHARILAERTQGARVCAVYDPDGARAESVAKSVGAEIVASAEAVISHADVDAVVIASPDVTHAPLTLACLDLEKPVMCEKPLAQSAAEARMVVARETEVGRRLVQVGFMRRYDPAHLALMQALAEGRVGEPQVMRGWHRNEASRPDITSARVVTGSLIHDLDSARWLMNEEIASVRVAGQRVGENVAVGQYDLLLAECRFHSGRHALLEVFVNARFGYEVGVEVIGSMGMAVTPGEGNAIIKRGRSAAVDVAPDWLVRFDTAYARQMAGWISGLPQDLPLSGA